MLRVADVRQAGLRACLSLYVFALPVALSEPFDAGSRSNARRVMPRRVGDVGI